MTTVLIAFITPMGLIIVAAINYWTAVRAAKDAQEARKATQEVALAAADSERKRAESASVTEVALTEISDTAHTIHTIVNSQHTKLLQLVARLTARVAAENPHDLVAQEDAAQAQASINKPLELQIGSRKP